MTNSEESRLARKINATEMILRRYFYQCIFQEGEDEALPALTPPQVEMVIAINTHGSMTVKQLAQVLHVKAPSISNRVERLVETGMVTREENPADRREVLVRIAPKKMELMARIEQRKLQGCLDLIEKLGPEHAHMWQVVCERIEEILGKTGYGASDRG